MTIILLIAAFQTGFPLSQTYDLSVSRSSDQILIIGQRCSFATTCNVRVGGAVYSIARPATLTLQGGTGTAAAYVSQDGRLTVRHNLALTCDAGCLAVTDLPSFPPGSVPLWTWTALNGRWDAAGGTDRRAFQSASGSLSAGTGITLSITGATTQVSIDRSTVGARVPVPVTASSACTAGSWAANAQWLYVCYAAGQWARSALSTW
jgi:hypothetical protein